MKHSAPTLGPVAGTPLSVLVAVLAPAACWAHPGHGWGGGDWSIHHYLTEPEHLVVALFGLVLVAVGVLFLLKTRARSTRGAMEQTIRRPDDLSARAKRAR